MTIPKTHAVSPIAKTRRELVNPDVRLALPADFPPVMNVNYLYYLQERLSAELAKHGETLETVKRLTVAFPRKDPALFPGHYDSALFVADKLVGKLRAATSTRADVQRADGICETVHLARSENQSVMHALTSRQTYRFNADAQTTPLAFVENNNDAPHYFVLADNQVEQGTTLATLASFIQHNGGTVLFAVCERGAGKLVPEPFWQVPANKGRKLSPRFDAVARPENIRALGGALRYAAVKEGHRLSINAALDEVEEHLNTQGSSLTSLTNLEGIRLLHAVNGRSVSYAQLTGRAKGGPA